MKNKFIAFALSGVLALTCFSSVIFAVGNNEGASGQPVQAGATLEPAAGSASAAPSVTAEAAKSVAVNTAASSAAAPTAAQTVSKETKPSAVTASSATANTVVSTVAEASAATAAQTQATVAETKATVAATQATAAETKATVAETKATVAETKATVAETKATVAETKATAAETKTTVAATKATAAETKATVAETKATVAATKATAAATKVTAAATKATTAATEATVAETKTTAPKAAAATKATAPKAAAAEVKQAVDVNKVRALRSFPKLADFSEFIRIFHIDCGRKYFTPDELKALIKAAAENGYTHVELAVGNNGLRFLLDDMSVSVNSQTFGSAAVTAAVKAGNRAYTGNSIGELTQAEMDSIIAFAADKGVGIIPLLNTPGHMNALLSAGSALTRQNLAYRRLLSSSQSTIDVTNKTATDFTLAVLQKYVSYFAEKGCKFFNIGADEFANDIYFGGFRGLIDNGQYGSFINYVNDAAAIVQDAGMTPMAFNDGIYYNNNTSVGTFDSNIVICYWTTGWPGYTPASAQTLVNAGHSIISTNDSWYYVLGRHNSGSYALNSAKNGTSNVACTTIPGGSGISPVGCMACLWCDEPGAAYDAAEQNNVTGLMKNFADHNADKFSKKPEPAPQPEEVTLTDPGTGVSATAYDLTDIKVALKATVKNGDTVSKTYSIDLWNKDGAYTGQAKVRIPVDRDFAECSSFTATVDSDPISVIVDNGYFDMTVPHFSDVTITGVLNTTPEDLSNVPPIRAEFWCTSIQLIGPEGKNYREITAEEIKNGAYAETFAPNSLQSNPTYYYWKARVIDRGLTNGGQQNDNVDTGDNECVTPAPAAYDIDALKYSNGHYWFRVEGTEEWKVLNWTQHEGRLDQQGQQLVFYYMARYIDTSLGTINTSDWGASFGSNKIGFQLWDITQGMEHRQLLGKLANPDDVKFSNGIKVINTTVDPAYKIVETVVTSYNRWGDVSKTQRYEGQIDKVPAVEPGITTMVDVYIAKKAEYTVKYNWLNEPSGVTLPAAAKVAPDTEYTVDTTFTDQTVKNDGPFSFKFSGWYLDKDYTVKAPAKLTITGDTTLYGRWEKTLDDTIIITAKSATRVYNGEPLTAPGFTVKYKGQTVPENSDGTYTIEGKHVTVTAVVNGTITDVGEAFNVIDSYQVSGDGITYKVKTDKGALEVTPKITVNYYEGNNKDTLLGSVELTETKVYRDGEAITLTQTQLNKFKPADCLGGVQLGDVPYVVLTGNEQTIDVVYPYAFADLKIIKTGWDKIDENQSFVFTVTGSGYDGVNVNQTVILNGGNNFSTVLKGLPVGTYTVTENTGWSWRYTGEAAKQITLSAGQPNSLTFNNVRADQKTNPNSKWKWLNGSAWSDNRWVDRSNRNGEGR